MYNCVRYFKAALLIGSPRGPYVNPALISRYVLRILLIHVPLVIEVSASAKLRYTYVARCII